MGTVLEFFESLTDDDRVPPAIVERFLTSKFVPHLYLTVPFFRKRLVFGGTFFHYSVRENIDAIMKTGIKPAYDGHFSYFTKSDWHNAVEIKTWKRQARVKANAMWAFRQSAKSELCQTYITRPDAVYSIRDPEISPYIPVQSHYERGYVEYLPQDKRENYKRELASLIESENRQLEIFDDFF